MSTGELTWMSDERCRVGDTTFLIFEPGATPQKPAGDLFLVKPKPLVERYAEIVAETSPRNIFELGIFEGGSTVFLAELARPHRLVAVDRKAPASRALADYLAQDGRSGGVFVYTDVDQADRKRLGAIVDDAFGDEPLDLVFDDCSHLYEPTRDSFNELFPRLRPAGTYVIEDWRWAHPPIDEEEPEGIWPAQTPLTRLIFEIVLSISSLPGLVADVKVELRTVEITRGELAVDPSTFDVSQSYNARGRRLLGGG